MSFPAMVAQSDLLYTSLQFLFKAFEDKGISKRCYPSAFSLQPK